MYLIADAQCLQSPDSRDRGIGRYARNLLNAIATARPDWRIEAVENSRLAGIDRTSVDARIVVTPFEPLLDIQPAARQANDRFFGEWLCARMPDVILELNFFEEHTVVPSFPAARPALCGVVYDLIPLLFHEHYLADRGKMEWYGERLRQFAATDLALAISATTRDDVSRLMRWPAGKVVDISGAPEPPLPSLPAASQAGALQRLGIDRPFILCVGGADARKNLRGTLAGFAALAPALRTAYQLVVVCALSQEQEREWLAHVRALGVEMDVRFTNFVSDDVLQTLYERCRASVFLSFYEGLGLPVLESLRAGAPVVASNRSSIPEFSDRSTILIDPSSPSEVAAALARVLAVPREDGSAARQEFAAQFTWERTAAAAVTAIESTARPHPLRSGRIRIAWVSPLPPTRSGIADYSRELLSHLASDRLEIELVVSAQAVVDAGLASRYPVINEHEVHRRHDTAPFDLFVYHIGNSDLHVYMLDLMRRFPGLAVLHEVFLGGLALRAAEVGAWPGLADDLEREQATDLAVAMRAGEADHDRIAREAEVNRRLIAMSDAVAVHSLWSWRHLRGAVTTPVFHIPMGIRAEVVESIATARARLGLPADAFVVVTLGEVTAAKRLDRVIAAMAALPASIRQKLQFLVVGDTAVPMQETLTAAATAAGLADRIRFTGRVSIEDLSAFARAADACVQLRYPVRGETSAALLRALAGGGACIVSDTAGFAEAPLDVALRARTPEHEVDDLTTALRRLHDEAGLGAQLRENALAFVAREHRLEDAAARYEAAIALTVAQRKRSEAEWRDGAVSALSTAAAAMNVADRALVRWAELHKGGRESFFEDTPGMGSRRTGSVLEK